MSRNYTTLNEHVKNSSPLGFEPKTFRSTFTTAISITISISLYKGDQYFRLQGLLLGVVSIGKNRELLSFPRQQRLVQCIIELLNDITEMFLHRKEIGS